jgi:transcriptional regulator with GAF, ATPase, and Fis domain
METTTQTKIFEVVDGSIAELAPRIADERAPLRQTSFSGIISQCSLMQKVFATVQKVAKTSTTVLILGESGTGKELIARALHKTSGRAGKLVPVNCGAIPEEILESELFGHEKGAFTGAVNSRMGRFQLADGGTIFLDEIGEMSPKLQVKLLRVLQEKRIEPVGSTRSIDIDVRVVAATNKDLREEVRQGRFREDLYYRLQVVPVELPALRERTNDPLLLASCFMERACAQLGRPPIRFSEAAKNAFRSYQWPGNVRELENLIERLAILVDGSTLELADLPNYIAEIIPERPELRAQVEVIETLPEEGVDFNELVNSYETRLIEMALERTGGNKKAAAKLLKLNRTTLVEKIRKKGLDKQFGLGADLDGCVEGASLC